MSPVARSRADFRIGLSYATHWLVRFLGNSKMPKGFRKCLKKKSHYFWKIGFFGFAASRCVVRFAQVNGFSYHTEVVKVVAEVRVQLIFIKLIESFSFKRCLLSNEELTTIRIVIRLLLRRRKIRCKNVVFTPCCMMRRRCWRRLLCDVVRVIFGVVSMVCCCCRRSL